MSQTNTSEIGESLTHAVTQNLSVNCDVLEEYLSEGTPKDIIKRYLELPKIAASTDFGEFDTNIVVLDTETTGVSLLKDELTQIAAARIENGKVKDWFITFVNPGKPIPEDITLLTGITDEDVANAPTPVEALTQLVNFVGDAKIVAHNAYFDKNFLTNHPAGYPLFENLWIDSLDLSRICLPRMKSHRLIDLVKAFNAPLSTHRADEDVAATCALYRILLAAIMNMPTPLVREISRLASEKDWSTGAVFAFFAKRADAISEAEAGEDTSEKIKEVFSLQNMRKQRVTKRNLQPKRDASAMISEELAECIGADVDAGNATLLFPTEEEISEAFSLDGIVGAMYSDYQQRDEQLTMAQAVRKAFATSDNLVVEAGTGTGKSMAYLLPAALTALKNNINVGVSTKTNALLDQLVFYELPTLAKMISSKTGQELTYAALKGFTHYPCLRKVQRVLQSGPSIRNIVGYEKSTAPAIAGLLSFIEQTEYDDTDHLKIDFRLLPRYKITTNSNECMRRKCPFYGAQCFVHGVRRLAEASDIVVTNHSLLFCDVAADFSLLPPVRYLVMDEAHSAPDEARRALSLTISIESLNRLTHKTSGEDSKDNIFMKAERNVCVPHDLKIEPDILQEYSAELRKSEEDEVSDVFDISDFATLFYGLLNKAQQIAKKFGDAESDFATNIRGLLYFDAQKKSGYEYADIWINEEVRASEVFAKLRESGKKITWETERLVNVCQKLVALLENVPNAATTQREIASVTLDLKDFLLAADVIIFKDSYEYVYSAKLSRRLAAGANPATDGNPRHGIDDSLTAQLYNVGDKLNETLYANTHSVVFTSATLTVGDSFNSFESAMGLNTEEQSHARELVLDSSYNYDENMTVYIINDMPEPNTRTYIAELTRLLTQLHLAQNGSMLTLFTNRNEMESCYNEVNPVLKRNDLRLICQKWGVTTKGLRDEFLENEQLSLFALKSFWEGFDAPGSTLRGVVIPKLPFQKPSDPLSREREARDAQAWKTYSLPQAVLEIKQAAGRLIRKSSDTGILVLADSRLLTKSYGKVFINSLPSKNIFYMTAKEAAEEIARNNK